jgi:hypothetical protein
MTETLELFTEGELQHIREALLSRGFTVEEGSAAIFGRTFLFRRDLGGAWFLRTWLWERQTELLLRLGRHDFRGEVGPEHRFETATALVAYLDEAIAELEGWTKQEELLRCPDCGGWLCAREAEGGPVLLCRGAVVAQPRSMVEGGAGTLGCAGALVHQGAIRTYR